MTTGPIRTGNKPYEYRSVLDFGAKGDGVTDDTAAIQAAIESIFGGSAARSGIVHFPLGTYIVSSTINVPNCVTLRGQGIYASLIYAASGFSDPYLINLGDGRAAGSTNQPCFDSRLEDLRVDCLDQDVIGVYSAFINETSGLFRTWIFGSNTKGIHIDSGVPFPLPAQNYTFDDLHVVMGTGTTSGSIPIHIEGANTNFKGINLITVNIEGATQPSVGILCDRVIGGLISNIHCEKTDIGIDFTTSTGFAVSGYYGHPSVTTQIRLDANSNEYSLTGIHKGGGTNNIINLHPEGATITQDNVGLYAFGVGGSGTNQITTASLQANRLQNLALAKRPTQVIASGAITVQSSFQVVDTEAAAPTDDLETINGGSDNQLIVLRSETSSRAVVVKNGVGNIFLAGSDFTLDSSADRLVLMEELGNWIEISRSNNA